MNSTVINQLENYKAIEAVCVKNHSTWTDVKEFRGVFSRFALKVGQLDLISESSNSLSHHHTENLIKEIEQILNIHFDRFFDYLSQKNDELFQIYNRIRRNN
ncbi:hypothetical protein [Fluviicola taffensis]|uniref:Uncharacterized protein n=1 Tax=Fluviicola taffensis (strain DSM 16823 / NCIMB 13979 / RW262) TaxID=755732 RepID=F2ICB8_FLUTR|nr:hypothetical protein [Fluviicola taffensis]AEA44364.1 hypothetical protein Fluta_2378 [Fluviicola taffensis DSM 16823]